MNESSNFSTTLPTPVSVFVIRIILIDVKRYLIAILTCISLMTNHVEFFQKSNLIKINKH